MPTYTGPSVSRLRVFFYLYGVHLTLQISEPADWQIEWESPRLVEKAQQLITKKLLLNKFYATFILNAYSINSMPRLCLRRKLVHTQTDQIPFNLNIFPKYISKNIS